jgi:hypothetical protein
MDDEIRTIVGDEAMCEIALVQPKIGCENLIVLVKFSDTSGAEQTFVTCDEKLFH